MTMRKYKNNKDIVDRAIEALAKMRIPHGPPQELQDKTIAKLIDASGKSREPAIEKIHLSNRIGVTKSLLRYAAAAVLLIATGIVVGRLTAPRLPDVEEFYATVEPVIRQQAIEDTRQYCQLALANGYTQLKDEIQQQYRRDLSDFAIQTLAASSTVTNQRLQELIDAINTAQTQDHRWFASALNQIEHNRLQDKTQFAAGLETLALQTEDQLQRTRQDMAQLLSYTPPDSMGVDKSNNLNNINERSN